MEDRKKALREAFGAFMTGITVVTMRTNDGTPIGFTANSFSSVSLDPALLLVSIAKSSSSFEAFSETKNFAINVLAESQKDISNTFARPSTDRFAGLDWQLSEHGSPLLGGSSAWFDCCMHQVVDAGDHAILIGRVLSFESAGYAGLGYYRGGYFTPAKSSTEVIAGPKVVLNAIIAHDNKVLLEQTSEETWALPAIEVGPQGADEALNTLLQHFQPEASASFVYAVYHHTVNQHQYISFLCNTPINQPLRGCYVDLDALEDWPMPDPAQKSMLTRYRRESQIKTYGLYRGNHETGVVKEMFNKEL